MRELETSLQQFGEFLPLAVLDELRRRLRTRHYSYRTECSYADWVRQFLSYLSERQGIPHPRVESDGVRDYLTHLAVRPEDLGEHPEPSLCAILFLCRLRNAPRNR